MTKINPYQKTPCVGRCSTVYGDPICRGCKRFINEVSFWNQLQIEQKTAIWQRLERLADRIIPQFVEILDTDQLQKFHQQAGLYIALKTFLLKFKRFLKQV